MAACAVEPEVASRNRPAVEDVGDMIELRAEIAGKTLHEEWRI